METSLSHIATRQAVTQPASGNASPAQGNPLPVSAQDAAASAQPVTVDTAAERPAAEADSQPTAEQTERVAQQLNDLIKNQQRDLEFSVDKDSGRTILRVIHAESGEVIRQIPPEELLHLARAFAEGTGSLITDKA